MLENVFIMNKLYACIFTYSLPSKLPDMLIHIWSCC